MIHLRPYQERAVSDVRESFRAGHRRTLLVSCCGSGKTVIFSYISAGVARSQKRVLVLAHREHLLNQISATLKSFNVHHATVRGGSRGIPRTAVTVASVFTVASRLKHWPAPDLIIVDEGHHVAPGNSWEKVVSAFPKALVLGVSATPQRGDGVGLGLVFDHMVMGPEPRELIDDGYLADFDVYAPSAPDLSKIRSRGGEYVADDLEKLMGESSVTGDAVRHYLELTPGKSAVAFCVSIKHSEDVAASFRKSGVPAEAIHGKMQKESIAAVMKRFAARETLVLTSCDLVSEGWDLPLCKVAILLRPWKSKSQYLQQGQRPMRPVYAPGLPLTTLRERLYAMAVGPEPRAIILDHANCTRMHGFVDDDHDWQLTTDEKKKKKPTEEEAESVRTCPQCFAAHRPMPTCPKCGHVYEIKARAVKQVDGTLEKLERGEKAGRSAVDWQRQYYALKKVGERRKMEKPGEWAFNIVCNNEAKRLAGKRDVFGQPMINGLTASERAAIKEAVRV